MKEKVFTFLKDLEQNNNKEWFHSQAERYSEVRKETNGLFEAIYKTLASIDELEPLKIYRINRDLRFTKDKTPYKTHFSAYFGRKKPYYRGGFYIHIQPDGCFLGGGFWNPDKDDLLKIRQNIAYDDTLVKSTEAKNFKKQFTPYKGDELKSAPRGFDKDHPRLDLLKQKQFLFIHPLKDDEPFRPNFIDQVKESYQLLGPFYDYMTEILTTNENGELIV